MEISFIGQPFSSLGGWTANWLGNAVAQPDISRLRIAVAWAKRSGLSRIAELIQEFRDRGGTASMIVGIGEGGATVQGLRLTIELFNIAHVFHERGGRTFHPKVYLASGASSAQLLVGSNNVTAGGLFSNYEASLLCQLNLELEQDRALFESVESWFDTMLSDEAVCKPLTGDLLEALLEDPRYRISDEDAAAAKHGADEGDYDGVTIEVTEDPIFGQGSIPKAGYPPAAHVAKPVTATPSQTSATTPSHAPSAPASPDTAERWWKQMSASDAQQPSDPNSNPIGSLKLTKAGHNIDHVTYFRNTLFASEDWATQNTDRGPKEEAIVTFDVVIDGQALGQTNLKVDHALYRVAHQINVATWLHWGLLNETLGNTDYTGAWVVIERLANGTYRLEISWTAP